MEHKDERLSWDEYFLKMAMLTAERSTCLRRHVGAVLVRDRRIIATGYNGAPPRVPHCSDVGCWREENGIPSGQRQELCRAIHAEQNAVIQAALLETGTLGSTMYCTHTPCVLCAKILVGCKIVRFVTYGSYAEEGFRPLFEEAGIVFEQLPMPDVQINIKR